MDCVQLTLAFQQLLLAAALTATDPAAPPPVRVPEPPAATHVATSPGLGTLLPGWIWTLFG